MNASIDALAAVDPSPNWMSLHRCIRTTGTDWTPPPGLARLRRWPDLTEVPDQFVAPVARLCALLWHKPTASHLINRTLGGDRSENLEVLQMLQAFGYVELLSVAHHEAAAVRAEPEAPAASTKSSSGLSSFIGKLRQRLLG